MKIEEFNKHNLEKIRVDLNGILADYAQKRGLELRLDGGIKYSPETFRVAVAAKIIGAVTLEDLFFESQMERYGLQKNGIDGRVLIEYKSHSPKLSWVFTYNGKRYKCNDASAKKYFLK